MARYRNAPWWVYISRPTAWREATVQALRLYVSVMSEAAAPRGEQTTN